MGKPDEILSKSWAEIPRAEHVLDAGNTEQYETGSWATFEPVLLPEICIHCLICWVMCPDSSVLVEDDKVVGFDLFHCKGCAICEEVCPTKPEKAIKMVKKEL